MLETTLPASSLAAMEEVTNAEATTSLSKFLDLWETEDTAQNPMVLDAKSKLSKL
jgi:hypothetical protein